MKPEPPSRPDPVKWAERPLEWPRAAGHLDRLMVALDLRTQRQRRRRLAAAGAGLLAIVALTVSLHLSRPAPAALPAIELTRTVIVRPEQRTLPDGSVVELKPGAEIAVRFTVTSVGARDVELTRGEAHFQVAKDAARPFIVHARGVQLRAVGTAFSVDLEGNSVEMLVTEGRVAVEPTTHSASAAITLVEAGQRIAVTPSAATPPAVLAASADETRNRLAWRVPRLEFNETPLCEVIRLFNVHSGSRLGLADPLLGQLEISGALRADNPESLLRMLETNYPIAVLRHPDGAITLRSKR